MSNILTTEFSCKHCSHTGNFKQGYNGYRVSDVATCPYCNNSFDVSKAKGIEKWGKRLSFTLTNSNANYMAAVRIGGKVYEIPPNGKVSVTHYGYELFEYKEDNQWQPSTSTWYFCYREDWDSVIDVAKYADQPYSGKSNSSQKNSWW